MPRGGFILPVALAVAALIAGTIIFSAGLLRRGVVPLERVQVQARAQALYALDVALAQLQSAALSDTTATAPASILGEVVHTSWLGAWPADGSDPVWLVSGAAPDPRIQESTSLTPLLRAPFVATAQGGYAYAVEDLSLQPVRKLPRWEAIPQGFADSVTRLQQQTVAVPQLGQGAASSALSYGLLTNPLSGGWKQDLDAPVPLDETSQAVARWRSDTETIRGRPLVWAEAAVMLGVSHDPGGVPQLGLAFWAEAWNPYLQSLPFNATGQPDLRLRLQGPAGTVRYLNAAGALVGFEVFDLSAHTTAAPILTDLYGPMAPGEVRFITHYRLLPLSAQGYPDAESVQIDLPAGSWSFIFETLEGQPVQKIEGLPYDSFSRRFGYGSMTLPTFRDHAREVSHLIYSWRLREPLTTLLSANDPRAASLTYDSAYYRHEPDPARAAQQSSALFSPADQYQDGRIFKLFDVPQGSLVSVGSLYHMVLPGSAALALGGSAAGAANALFDQYFFSSLPPSSQVFGAYMPSPALTLPNVNLRLSGEPTYEQLQALPAASLLLQGAFNINSSSAEAWLSILPEDRVAFPFRTDLPTQPTPIAAAQRQAWAQALAGSAAAHGAPWRSVGQLAAADLLPGDVFCRASVLLQPRGDTFVIHALGSSQGVWVQLQAQVQRLPSPSGQGRRLQVLALRWVAAQPTR